MQSTSVVRICALSLVCLGTACDGSAKPENTGDKRATDALAPGRGSMSEGGGAAVATSTRSAQRDAGSIAANSSSGENSAPSAGAFSFFVTSLQGMRELSNNEQGFGGDLRYGEATGLAGADKICTELAERSMAGAGSKGWRAFLSTAKGSPEGGPTHAKDRIGTGPWYDRTGRVIATDLSALLQVRPAGADPAIVNDLPNERGEPNHSDAEPNMNDNHDIVTATNAQGMYDGRPTCDDFTSVETPVPMPMMGAAGRGGVGRGAFMHYGPGVGHSWPAQSGMSWTTAHGAPGCAPSVSLVQTGAGEGDGIGNGGGYGAIYCFALSP